MKISELSDRSGLTVQTIKYYIRENLLPKGTSTGATRAEYGERHLERLALIRALREVGDLPIASIKRIVSAVDDENVALHELMGTAHYAIGPHVTPHDGDAEAAARRDVDALIADLGWRVTADAPGRELLAQSFVALRRLGFPVSRGHLQPYIDAAATLSEHELDPLADDASRGRAVLGTLVTSVLYERVLIALRRLAQENTSARRFGTAGSGGSQP